ncbi:CDP-diacylglycerol--glycerol-3-phosphate 3-phosphatidyltransferase [Bachmanniomyces sp. S44760]|nr:CDP-diacylglycerol--glycerol-3-phosphate 3-phosphatidyltransferase [Bachmanniomyces sp. S44760]
MLARRAATCAIRRPLIHRLPQRQQYKRWISSSDAAGPPASSTNSNVIPGVMTELDRIAPRIDIKADQVKVLETPAEFYDTLKDCIRGAKKRIYLSTLYIGRTEHELVHCIRQALQENKTLKVSILTDALRGTRETPDPSCASLLSPLAADFPEQVEIRMYHTPNLTGLRKKLIPRRINEGWGLQHMKLYGVDDQVILSGANLSTDYFTNRQDRYHIFSSKRVADYFSKVHDTMCSLSYVLTPGQPLNTYTLDWPQTNDCPPPLYDPMTYTSITSKRLYPLITPSDSMQVDPNLSSPTSTTSLYPLLTIPRSVNNELPALQSLFSTSLPTGSSYLFTAGYFNPHPQITAALLACSSPSKANGGNTPGTVLTASPWANGFYGSKGISGMLPAAYTLLSRRFLAAANKVAPSTQPATTNNNNDNLEKGKGAPTKGIQLREWRRGTVGKPDGWTYHAKGLWLTLPSSTASSSSPLPAAGPSITLLGSSNYTTRSYTLDVECGVVLVTQDAGLQKALKREEEGLLMFSDRVERRDLEDGERRVGIGVRMAMWAVRVLGGAL